MDWRAVGSSVVTPEDGSFADDLLIWAARWRFRSGHTLPWNRARLHWEFMRRRAFMQWPINGNVLEQLREGRLEIGPGVMCEAHVWLASYHGGRIHIGADSWLNFGVFLAVHELIEIGQHCRLGNGVVIADANHRYDDLRAPVTRLGYNPRGAIRIGDNVTLGVHCVVQGGVTIGERCSVAANSVVTKDLPPYTICGGTPARVLKEIDYPDELKPDAA